MRNPEVCMRSINVKKAPNFDKLVLYRMVNCSHQGIYRNYGLQLVYKYNIQLYDFYKYPIHSEITTLNTFCF